MLLGKNSISAFFAECKICVSLKDRMIKWLPRENISSQKVLNQKIPVEHKKDGPNPSLTHISVQTKNYALGVCSKYLLT